MKLIIKIWIFMIQIIWSLIFVHLLNLILYCLGTEIQNSGRLKLTHFHYKQRSFGKSLHLNHEIKLRFRDNTQIFGDQNKSINNTFKRIQRLNYENFSFSHLFGQNNNWILFFANKTKIYENYKRFSNQIIFNYVLKQINDWIQKKIE